MIPLHDNNNIDFKYLKPINKNSRISSIITIIIRTGTMNVNRKNRSRTTKMLIPTWVQFLCIISHDKNTVEFLFPRGINNLFKL